MLGPVDVVDSPLQSELVGDAMDLEAESWSLAVQPHFCKSQEKHIIKRQDVIYGVCVCVCVTGPELGECAELWNVPSDDG